MAVPRAAGRITRLAIDFDSDLVAGEGEAANAPALESASRTAPPRQRMSLTYNGYSSAMPADLAYTIQFSCKPSPASIKYERAVVEGGAQLEPEWTESIRIPARLKRRDSVPNVRHRRLHLANVAADDDMCDIDIKMRAVARSDTRQRDVALPDQPLLGCQDLLRFSIVD